MSTSEKRQRVNRACDECKRKKKQCTGAQPCTLCVARSRVCVFSTLQPSRSNNNQLVSTNATQGSAKRKVQSLGILPQEGPMAKKTASQKDLTVDNETLIQNNERLLRDGRGRHLYIGDSASLSFLQNIRRLIEGAVGPSSFTTDSSRHTILEAAMPTAPSNQTTCMLPDNDTTLYLVNSFFQNTIGLVDIFNKKDFLDKVEKTYDQPLDANPAWLCQLYLVLAVGLQMRRNTSNPNATESRILSRLGAERTPRAEIFFLTAKHLNDSVYGFEEGGIEAVQSLLLMAVYMLTASKRNTAWVYIGMAVRLAYALGIHIQETLLVFSTSDQTARINLWQSLQIMDCFLSASLGRPSSITHTCGPRSCPPTPKQYQNSDLPHPTNNLQQSVATSEIISEILTRIYHKRKVSQSVAYALTLHFGRWKEALPAELHWHNILVEAASPELAIKRLHVNLLYFHGIILLTRPFFLHQVSIKINGNEQGLKSGTSNAGSEGTQTQNEAAATLCFHGACVHSAVQTLVTVYSALISNVLPTRDPFITYWVFSASLVVLTNAFCPVFVEPDTEPLICKGLSILKRFGDLDAGARRYLSILEAFNDVIQSKKKSKPNENQPLDSRNISDILFGKINSSSTSQETPTSVQPQTSINLGWENGARNHMDNAINVIPNVGVDRYGTVGIMPPGAYNWQLGECGGFDEPIDIDWAWFPGGQKNFNPTNEVQVPLYNLMDTF